MLSRINADFVEDDNSWFVRGGNYDNGSEAGSFQFENNNGNANNNNSARAALVSVALRPQYINFLVTLRL